MKQRTDKNSNYSVFDKKIKELFYQICNLIGVGEEKEEIIEKLIKDSDGAISAENIRECVDLAFQKVSKMFTLEEKEKCVKEHCIIYDEAYQWLKSQNNQAEMNKVMAAKERLLKSWESIRKS